MLELPHNVCMFMIASILLMSSYVLCRAAPKDWTEPLHMWYCGASMISFLGGTLLLVLSTIFTFAPKGL